MISRIFKSSLLPVGTSLLFALALTTAWSLIGCQGTQFDASGGSPSLSLSGAVRGGQQPITGAKIQLYAAGSTGDGSPATSLLTAPVTTDSHGSFDLTGLYKCPTPVSDVYLVVTGGNPGLESGATNAQIALMVALGQCGRLSARTEIQVNEVTTVAAVYALSPFMQSYTAIGSDTNDGQMMDDAFSMATELADTGTGATPGIGIPTGQAVPSQKLNTLANILSACINTRGGSAGDLSPCGRMFSFASASVNTAPADTVEVLLDIARNPASNVIPIFDLAPPTQPFQPSLSSPPADWTIGTTSPMPSPIFSPSPGTFVTLPPITLFDSDLSAAIYYTVDGSTPTLSSIPYTGAFALSGTSTIRALAIAGGISSLLAAGTYTIQGGAQPPMVPPLALALVFLTSPSNVVSGSVIAPAAQVALEDRNGDVIKSFSGQVTLTLAPNSTNSTLSGTLSAAASAGIATFGNAVVTAQGSGYQLVASSPGIQGAVSASFAATAPIFPVTVSVTPANVTMAPSQTQAFTATVTNTPNTAVTWSLSPAVGSISVTGIYIAPASISSSQTVTVTATSMSDPGKQASAHVTIAHLVGTSYYLAPATGGGNDSNSGRSSSAPWLTPNHSVKCGDVIVASASSSYSAANFTGGKWGTVTCATGNNVAWLQCVTFDACKISVSSGTLDGMRVSSSYWGVQGWEVSNTAGGAAGGNCFSAVPATSTASIHHIIFANDIANVCPLDGISSGNNGLAGVDYVSVLGSIAYGAGVSNTWCGSGISVYEPVASDSLPGTHIYVAGNFSYSNTNPSGCWDGNGIIFDDFDGDQTPMSSSYSQQGVIDNNITISNGGVGVRIEFNNAGAGPTHSDIYARRNTMWGNNMNAADYGASPCGELMLYKTVTTRAYLNIASTNQAGCYGNASVPAYAFSVANIDATSSVYQNVGWSTTGSFNQSTSSVGFSFGANNLFGSNPGFAKPTTPGAPACSTYPSAPACMATVVANFTPITPEIGYGYQIQSSTPNYDPMFPQWLCNVNLPVGLVTMGCRTGP